MYTDGERLVSEFKPDPTRTVCCRLFTGYAGFSGESDLWADLLQQGLEGQPVSELRDIEDGRGRPACWHNRRTFVFWSHIPRQPWQTRDWLASMEDTLPSGEYARVVHCDFAESEESFVQEAWWDQCRQELPELQPGDSTPLVVGVDASVSGDCSAIVAVSRHPERHDDIAVRFAYIWNPENQPGQVIDQSRTIEPTLRRLINDFGVVCVVFDPYQLEKLTRDLQREGLGWFEAFPQGNGSKKMPGRTVADARLRQMIMHRQISHDGNPLLRQHITNAAARITGDGSKLRIVKKAKNLHVDGAVALSMACMQASRLNL
jgi:hypothetical protein